MPLYVTSYDRKLIIFSSLVGIFGNFIVGFYFMLYPRPDIWIGLIGAGVFTLLLIALLWHLREAKPEEKKLLADFITDLHHKLEPMPPSPEKAEHLKILQELTQKYLEMPVPGETR